MLFPFALRAHYPPGEKVTHDKQRGLLSFFRVYSGMLEAKVPVYNATRGAEERPLQVCHAFVRWGVR